MSCDNPAASEKDGVMHRRPKFDRSKDCVKCKEKRGNIIVRHAVFCKACFFPFVTAKFKRALDPFVNEKTDKSRRKVLKASGNLLLGFSGSLGSTILLDIINRHYLSPGSTTIDEKPKGGKDHPRNDRIWRKVYVCYVETCAAFPKNARERTREVTKVIEQYENVEFIPLRIEDAFDHDWWIRDDGNAEYLDLSLDMSDEDLPLTSESGARRTTPPDALRLYLSSLPTQTAIATAIRTLIRRLLLQTALETGSSHLLLGASLTSLSIAHISSIAQGGGYAVREEAQEEWKPVFESRSVRIIRPLRDVGMKECGVWAWWRGLHIVGRDRYPGGKQEIGTLTRDFIVGLEADYPSTVSTIARTCAKVEPKEKTEAVCMMCERPAQRDVEEWKSRISIKSYVDLTEPYLPSHVREVRPSNLEPPSLLRPDKGIGRNSLTPYLCYLCHTMLVSKSSRGATLPSANGSSRTDGPVPLPVWVNAKLQTPAKPVAEDGPTVEEGQIFRRVKMDETAMKNALGGFLLTDD
ncbi:hypothetical protein AX15_004589 [Amanita polypyramis BW_CC]|nr:hypothetical protein AX15_004589 [Amanita polypyramis BW_CC]